MGYTLDEFKALVKEFDEHESALLCIKANEYGSEQDRLENFHWRARAEGKRPEEIALGDLLKHIHAIVKAIKENRYCWVWQSESGEGLKQRLADARNYLLLLAACIDEAVWSEGNGNR